VTFQIQVALTLGCFLWMAAGLQGGVVFGGKFFFPTLAIFSVGLQMVRAIQHISDKVPILANHCPKSFRSFFFPFKKLFLFYRNTRVALFLNGVSMPHLSRLITIIYVVMWRYNRESMTTKNYPSFVDKKSKK
jgi:uncharacterized membrane protein YesL